VGSELHADIHGEDSGCIFAPFVTNSTNEKCESTVHDKVHTQKLTSQNLIVHKV
jgi:hypothetical protein